MATAGCASTPAGGDFDRTVRVFVSSTFQDMQAERDELIKRVFPQLRKMCESRGVTWGEVDLRWGITQEKAERGEVLPACFGEIRRCRPFFIGLLGDRYGSTPRDLPKSLLRDEPWIEAYPDASITELEIACAVLRNPVTATSAFFYFRAPAPGGFAGPASSGTDKIERLKAKIRASGATVRDNYSDAVDVGRLVLADFSALIDRLYPSSRPVGRLEREAAAQAAHARKLTTCYVEPPEAFGVLDKHTAAATAPLVVVGEAGSGKSALLANWALRHAAANPRTLVLTHAVGAGGVTDIAGALALIVGEIHRTLGIPKPPPESDQDARTEFGNWLHLAAAKQKVVLAIDGLDHLEDREGAHELDWIPPRLPENLRLVVSCRQGASARTAAKLGWDALPVHPLDRRGGTSERKKLINAFLLLYGKEMDAARAERVASAGPCADPLFLTTLLEELRHYGDHKTLDRRIDHLLGAQSVLSLFRLVLDRYVEDFDRDRPGLVADAVSLLCVARYGLSEAELLDLLGAAGAPLPHAIWSPLYLALERNLRSRHGVLSFTHKVFRQAGMEAYLPTTTTRRLTHERLAGYFEHRERSDRRNDELPWSLSQAGRFDALRALLVDAGFFQQLWLHSQEDTLRYWTAIEETGLAKAEDSYPSVLAEPGNFPEAATSLANMFWMRGQTRQAHDLREALVAHFRRAGDEPALADVLPNYGVSLRARGEFDKALAAHREAGRIYQQLGEIAGVALCLGNEAAALHSKNDLSGALALYQRQEALCGEIEDWNGIARSLNNQASLLADWGEYRPALELLDRAAQMDRRAGDFTGLLIGLSTRAKVHMLRGEAREALALLTRIENEYRQLGDSSGAAKALERSARMIHDMGDPEEAMQRLERAAAIWRGRGNNDALVMNGGHRALLLWTRGLYEEALPLLVAAEDFFRKHGDLRNLAEGLSQRANILVKVGQAALAESLLNEAQALCIQIFDRVRLAGVIISLGWLRRQANDLAGAFDCFQKAERIAIELGDESGRAKAIGNQGVILKAAGQYDHALKAHEEEQRVFQRLGDMQGLQVSLGNEGAVHSLRGDHARAFAAFQKSERLCRQLKNYSALASCLGNQAFSLEAQGKVRVAVRKHQEAEELFRRLGEVVGLVKTLVVLAKLYRTIGKRKDADAAAAEARAIARDAKIPMLAPILRLLDQ